ncbi:hypothetical protein GECvBMG_gp106c [Salmonella phage GEC_vB_MG]|uniref:Uncharacterized protein 98 n=2 Tax=Seunavirus TaxID=1914851 RepID=G3BLW3_9CAUD|nr:hypothetical protein PVP-SE1_gp097 [Salmonella phage PVPSE1]YP_009149024.1 hypothetical protein ACQ19_gp228 [Salmonella phage SSE121]ADP02493.1 conserved hypothetical protein [Salmonella phage PVPSE1]AFU63869.1 hypothetical protein [Salmonella phage SSE121]QPI14650.1 hypothetical protein GECvBMG_gp106c [Salmonella phage GEC_vB_MG]
MLEVIKSKEISASEKVLLMFMGLNGVGVYTYQDFINSTGLSRATVGRSLSSLYEKGWIEKKTAISDSGAESIQYSISFGDSTNPKFERTCYVYVQELAGPGLTIGKVGIAFNVFERMRQQSKKSLFQHKLMYSKLFKSYAEAAKVEQIVLSAIPQFVCEKDWLPDGFTETIHKQDILKAIQIIEEK